MGLRGFVMDVGGQSIPREVEEGKEEITEEKVEALVVIFQESPESGRIPEDWKIANVNSLLKKGIRQRTGNYRPMSLTFFVGKILESIVKDEISEYLEVHG
eukprot:g30346.t1